MKIDRLYTLSQFADYVDSISIQKLNTEDSYVAIFNYNKFLKQALKKEMFVNEILNPERLGMHYSDVESYNKDMLLFKEAVEKVIFPQSEGNYSYDYLMDIDNEMTLGDLAEFTINEQLELKNVEI